MCRGADEPDSVNIGKSGCHIFEQVFLSCLDALHANGLQVIDGVYNTIGDEAGLLADEGRDSGALRHYKEAQRSDPLHADVQLNLALLYDRLSLPRRAREHWRRYLQLEPEGGWAAVARKHLEGVEPTLGELGPPPESGA